MIIRLWVLALAGIVGCAASARQLVWMDRPLDLDIAADAETQLILPAPVRVRVPAVHAHELAVESFGRTVLIRPQPKAQLRDVRLVLQDLADGSVVLIDVTVAARASVEPIEIIRPADAEPVVTAAGHQTDPRVALLRFAAKEYFAPPRLRGGLAVTRQSVTIDDVALYDAPEVVAKPLASWSALRLYVTAVQLRNTSDQAIDLDPGRLRGTFELAAFHSTRLLPADGPYDHTVVFLVSVQPFREAAHER